MENIEIPGIGEIKVRRSANIRYLSIRMAPGRGIWVNVPYGHSYKQVEKYILSQREWIEANIPRIKAYEKDTGVGLRIGAEIKTKQHVLKIAETEEIKPGYKMEGELITLFIPKKNNFDKIDGIIKKFLVEIYKMECRHILPEKMRTYAEKFGFRYARLSFRDNISNWGSCSYDDNISLNIKLMKLPDELIDYVILHELCHTVEKNHSAAFWKLVKQVCPDFETRRHLLRNYNTRL